MTQDRYAFAIGASSGGVSALLEIAAALPRDLPAFVFVVQHIGQYQSVLPELMRARGARDARHPADGEQPVPGTIYVAPPDFHMLVEDDRIRLFRGPKENHCRPAIDPLFHSVAIAFRERAVGVVLTGSLDDGTAGLRAIKDRGGRAIVQDPATAVEPGMPQSALDNVDVDWLLPLAEIAPTLGRIVGEPSLPGAPLPLPDALRREQLILHGTKPMQNLDTIAKRSSMTCPDCGGGLWELNEQRPLRYRCHAGHAFSAQTLEHSQQTTAEHALWSSVRALREKEMLLRRLATVARGNGDQAQAQACERQADRARGQSDELVRMIEHPGASA